MPGQHSRTEPSSPALTQHPELTRADADQILSALNGDTQNWADMAYSAYAQCAVAGSFDPVSTHPGRSTMLLGALFDCLLAKKQYAVAAKMVLESTGLREQVRLSRESAVTINCCNMCTSFPLSAT